MKNIVLIFAAIVISLCSADTQVYRLELDTNTDCSRIVGQDGVRRECVIVEPEQFSLLTGQLSRVWASLNSTDNGRIGLHGKKMNTTIDTNTLTKTTVYADGFRHAESFEIRTRPVMDKFSGVKRERTVQITEKPKGTSDRRWEMRQAYIRRLTKAPKVITVTHDATTGKDEVEK